MSLAPHIVAEIERLLGKYDIAQIKGRLRQATGVVISHQQAYDVYAAIAATTLARRRVADFRSPIDPPADFAARAAQHYNPALAEYYGANIEMISRWRREVGIKPLAPKAGRGREPAPADFACRVAGRSIRAMAADLGMSIEKTTRWFREAGIPIVANSAKIRPDTNRNMSFKVTSVVRSAQDFSRAGMAADHLRRFGQVFRCNERGGPDPKGSHWRRGQAVLTDTDLIERAQRLGWQPDAWKAVRATNEGARA